VAVVLTDAEFEQLYETMRRINTMHDHSETVELILAEEALWEMAQAVAADPRRRIPHAAAPFIRASAGVVSTRPDRTA
jgi:hypothetical protein